MPDVKKDLDDWRQSVLTDFTDHRIVDTHWVDAHIWFFEHMYADLNEFGLECYGYSFKAKHEEWLLVLKVRTEDTPYVVFVSSQNPTRCMSKLRSLLRNGGPKLYEDRFA